MISSPGAMSSSSAAHLQRGGAGMGEQRLRAAALLLDPAVAAPGERPVTGELRAGMGLRDIVELLARHVGGD